MGFSLTAGSQRLRWGRVVLSKVILSLAFFSIRERRALHVFFSPGQSLEGLEKKRQVIKIKTQFVFP